MNTYSLAMLVVAVALLSTCEKKEDMTFARAKQAVQVEIVLPQTVYPKKYINYLPVNRSVPIVEHAFVRQLKHENKENLECQPQPIKRVAKNRT